MLLKGTFNVGMGGDSLCLGHSDYEGVCARRRGMSLKPVFYPDVVGLVGTVELEHAGAVCLFVL
jgi:hypothetical protein